MKILGIETSCDETAAAVVENGEKLMSNDVASSVELHKEFGGVVPEIAARSQIEEINPVIEAALKTAKCKWDDIDAIAVTYGPGLGGSLLVGVLTARTLAITHKKPLFAVNHVLAHIYATFLTSVKSGMNDKYKLSPSQPEFPILSLIVSGGHTQLVLFENHQDYRLLGTTTDDAVGEAYDKVAKILGLPYPGGPSLEKLALKGNPEAYKLPKPKAHGEYDLSYSGLKTAVLRLAQREIGEDYNFPSHKLAGVLTDDQKANIAARFNNTAVEMLVDKLQKANDRFAPSSIVVAGGVSASRELRRQIKLRIGNNVYLPDIKLCTDNGAMIATYAYYLAQNGVSPSNPKTLETNPSLAVSFT